MLCCHYESSSALVSILSPSSMIPQRPSLHLCLEHEVASQTLARPLWLSARFSKAFVQPGSSDAGHPSRACPLGPLGGKGPHSWAKPQSGWSSLTMQFHRVERLEVLGPVFSKRKKGLKCHLNLNIKVLLDTYYLNLDAWKSAWVSLISPLQIFTIEQYGRRPLLWKGCGSMALVLFFLTGTLSLQVRRNGLSGNSLFWQSKQPS